MGLPPEIHRYIIAVLFLITGILHFIKPQVFVSIMPDFVPCHLVMVYVSGGAEITGALGLLFPQTQIWAAWGLILLLVAVFPANINMAVEAVEEYGYTTLWSAATLFRLPLQFLLIYWVYWACLH